jgi:hypothetical protein
LEEQEEFENRNFLPEPKEGGITKDQEGSILMSSTAGSVPPPKSKTPNYNLYDEDDLMNAIFQITNTNHVDSAR